MEWGCSTHGSTMLTNECMPGAGELMQILYRCSMELRGLIESEIPPRFRSRISVEDVLQEVWITAFQCEYGAIRDWNSWFRRVAQTKLIDMCRNARAIKRGGKMNEVRCLDARLTSYVDLFDRIAGNEHTPSWQLSAEEVHQAVSLALASLPESRRRAVELCHVEGLSRQEIAARMNKSESAVNSLIHAGLRQLRASIGAATGLFDGRGSSNIHG
jgi:RNA polymerase sigma factor (sigma-70 family)